jgi:hypothetical protein
MLVLDISCQLLGDECKLDSFCAPFGRGDGKCTFLEIHIDMKSNSLGHFRQLEAFVGIGYIMQQFGGIYFGGLYMMVLDISCQLLGDECKLDSFCAPFGRGDGKFSCLEMIFLVDYIC